MNFGGSPVTRCDTGTSGLDHILGGGFPPHALYLVQGDPGVGKTTLAMQFLLAGSRRSESCLYVTFSETREELFAVAHSHGWTLDGISFLELSNFAQQLTAEAENTLFDPADVELQDVTKIVFAEIERIKPRRAVFDSMSELRLLSQGALRYRRQVLSIKQVLTAHACTTLLLDDLTSADSKDDRQLESVCHGVIALRRQEQPYGADRLQMSIRKIRGSNFLGGPHDYVIETGGVKVFPRIVPGEHHRDFARESVSCGIEGIDTLVGGGLDRGTSNLLMGPSGTGKSSLALTYAYFNATRGERVALFTFDENLGLYLSKATSFGIDLRALIRDGFLRARQVDPAELSPGQFAQLLLNFVEQENARMVVIDSLNGYSKAMQGGNILDLQLHETLTYLGQLGVVTIMVLAQGGLLNELRSLVDLTYLADTVIILRHFEAEGSIRQAISIAKKRSGGHERTIRELRVTAKGLWVGEPLFQFRGVLTGVPVLESTRGPMENQKTGDTGN
ncbi:MAG TPA: ATPase domain-containing protein [Chthoniobacterales bacterium]|nr:ATPase domain-containing protein [Chthoniobacterales bacterium]